jgi:hypothetical protein
MSFHEESQVGELGVKWQNRAACGSVLYKCRDSKSTCGC